MMSGMGLKGSRTLGAKSEQLPLACSDDSAPCRVYPRLL
jgi:hypothetical protein